MSGLKQSALEGSLLGAEPNSHGQSVGPSNNLGSDDSGSDNENSYSPSPKKMMTSKQLTVVKFD